MGTRGASVGERFQEVVQTVAAHLCISALISLMTLLLSTAVSLVLMRSILLCGAIRIMAARRDQSVLAAPGTAVFVVVDGACARYAK